MLDIVKLPTQTLRSPSKELLPSDLEVAEISEFISKLTPSMYAANGIGIASCQVGNNIRACVIGKDAIPRKSPFHGDDLILINPTFQRLSKKAATEKEGCLSVPGVFGPVKRWKNIAVTALDINGNKLQFEAKNFFARVIQHEVDHLNGMLFVDRAEALDAAEAEDLERYKEDLRIRNVS